MESLTTLIQQSKSWLLKVIKYDFANKIFRKNFQIKRVITFYCLLKILSELLRPYAVTLDLFFIHIILELSTGYGRLQRI